MGKKLEKSTHIEVGRCFWPSRANSELGQALLTGQLFPKKKHAVTGGDFWELAENLIAEALVKRERLEAGGFQKDLWMAMLEAVVLDRGH